MFKVEIDGVKHDAAVTCITPSIYELEFGSDMVSDFIGRVDDEGNGFVEVDRKGTVVAVDYTTVKWNNVLKCLWAALKTVNDKMPGFKAWAKGVSGLNVVDVRVAVSEAIDDCFFRARLEEDEPEGEGEGEGKRP